jgi:hypothetical protein
LIRLEKHLPAIAGFFLLVFGVAAAIPAEAAEVKGLYEATVPLERDTQAQRAAAFREAMGIVLVRVTGNPVVLSDPQSASLISQSETYVQQFRRTREGNFWVGFDGEAVNRALIDLGLPIWGAERPSVLLLLALDKGAGERFILSAEDELPDPGSDALREQLAVESELRGVPLVLPLMDAQDRSILSFNEVWGGFDQALSEAGRRYGTDAILLGRYSFDAPRAVRWTLYEGDQAQRWQGKIDQGVPGAGDRFAIRYAVATSAALEGEVGISIAAIENLVDYGRVLSYLESLTAVEAVSVRGIQGDQAVFGLRLRGNLENVDQAIRLGGLLRREQGPTTTPDSPDEPGSMERRVALAYRLVH